jgi:hypothetical protein
MANLGQVVRTHQPDEADSRKTPLQRGDRIAGETSAKL